MTETKTMMRKASDLRKMALGAAVYKMVRNSAELCMDHMYWNETDLECFIDQVTVDALPGVISSTTADEIFGEVWLAFHAEMVACIEAGNLPEENEILLMYDAGEVEKRRMEGAVGEILRDYIG